MRKFFAVLLSLVLLAGLLPVQMFAQEAPLPEEPQQEVQAQDDPVPEEPQQEAAQDDPVLGPAAESFGNYEYAVDGGGKATITGYTGNEENLIIPSTLDSKPVVAIGGYAFQSHVELKSVVIPTGVTSIGSGAFLECDNLSSITLPEGIVSIGTWVFDDCSALAEITLPASLTEFWSYGFVGCSSLAAINVAAGNTSYASENGVLFNAAKTTLLKYPQAKSSTGYSVPATVTEIADHAFANNQSMASISLPEGLETISASAFDNCSALTQVTLPASLKTLGGGVFDDCKSLAAINVTVGNANYASENGVLFNMAKTTLLKYPQAKSGTSYTVPASVTKIENAAFSGCGGLTSITLPQGLKTIGEGAFSACGGLKYIGIPAGVTGLGYYTFSNCTALVGIYIPPSVVTITTYAFEGSDKLTIYGEADSYAEAYAGENGIPFKVADASGGELMEILIAPTSALVCVGDSFTLSVSPVPSSAALPGNLTFSISAGGENVVSVVNNNDGTATVKALAAGTATITASGTVSGNAASPFSADCTLKVYADGDVADESFFTYSLRADGKAIIISYSGDMAQLVIPASLDGHPVAEIGASAFSSHDELKSVVIPAGVTSIGNSAFAYCYEISSIALPEGLETIGSSAFAYCRKLSSISLPEGLTTLGASAFERCFELRYISIPAGVTELGEKTFGNCPLLAGIYIPPETVTISENGVFEYTENVTIYGAEGSDAEAYADENGIPFRALDPSGGLLELVTAPASALRYVGDSFTLYTHAFPSGAALPGDLTFSISEGGERIVSVTPNGDGTATVKALAAGTATITVSGTAGGNPASPFSAGCTLKVYAPGDVPDEDLYKYSLRADGKAVIIDYDGNMARLVVPSNLDGHPVAEIGSSVFWSHNELESVVIPKGIASIGEGAFTNCINLSSVTFPEGLETIGNSAFSGCVALSSVTLPAGLKAISYEAFLGCENLTSVTLPQGLEAIGGRAFQACSALSSITFPAGLKTIGDAAFAGCGALSSLTLPQGLETIGSGAFSGCSKLSSVTFPEGLETIGDAAFRECGKLSSLTLPIRLVSIGERAFEFCSALTSVSFPEGLKTIGDNAFSGCGKLSSITLREGIETIGDGAFAGCMAVSSITLPQGLVSIGEGAFGGCIVTQITLPASLAHLGDYAFSTCYRITAFNVAAGSTHFASENGVLFNKDKTTLLAYPKGKSGASYTLPATVTEIATNAFSGCQSLTSITLPDGLKTIGDGAFSACIRLSSITLPEGLETIGRGAFDACQALTQITLPASLTSIDLIVFQGSTRLTAINVAAGNPMYASVDGVLFNKDKTVLLMCPQGKTGSYRVPAGVTEIAAKAFSYSKMTSITLPEGLKTIGDEAFLLCGALTSMTLPNGLETIGNQVFYECARLTSVTLPEGLTTMGYSVFSYCSALTELTFPASLTSIGGTNMTNVIGYCKSLAAFNVAEGNPSFTAETGILFNADKTMLIKYPPAKSGASYTVPATVTELDTNAFAWCVNLTSITLPDGLKTIGGAAFFECTALKYLEIPAGVTSLGWETFHYCFSLVGVYIPPSVVDIYCEFGEPGRVTLYGAAGSSAEAYAAENGIPFVVADGLPGVLSSIALSTTAEALYAGESFMLGASPVPSRAALPGNLAFNLSKGGDKVVSVLDNKDGTATVTALAAGTATITVSGTVSGNAASPFKATCTVTVTLPPTPWLNITSTPAITQGKLTVGASAALNCSVLPAGTPMDDVEWRVDNAAIVSLAASGTAATITANAPGKTTVWVSAASGTKTLSGWINLTVEARPNETLSLGMARLVMIDEVPGTLDVNLGAPAERLKYAIVEAVSGASADIDEILTLDDSAPAAGGTRTVKLTPKAGVWGSYILRVAYEDSALGGAWAECRLDIAITSGDKTDYPAYMLDPASVTVSQKIELNTTAAQFGLWPNADAGIPVSLLDNGVKVRFKETTDAARKANTFFDLVPTGENTVDVRLKTIDGIAKKYSGELEILLPGVTEPLPVTGKLTINVNSAAPAVKAAKVVVNTFYDDRAATIAFTGGTVTALKEATTGSGKNTVKWAMLGGTAPNFTLTFDKASSGKSGTMKLLAQVEGWGENWFPVNVPVQRVYTAPAAKLASSTLSLYMDYDRASASYLYIAPKKSGETLTDLGITNVEIDARSAKANYFVMSDEGYNIHDGSFRILPAEGATAAQMKGTLPLLLTVKGTTDPANKIKLNLTVRPVAPGTAVKLVADKTTVTLNPNLAAGDSQIINLRPTIAEFDLANWALENTMTVELFKASDKRFTNPLASGVGGVPACTLAADGASLEVRVSNGDAYNESYKVRVTMPQVNTKNGKKVDSVLTLTLKTTPETTPTKNYGPKASLKVKGKVNLTTGAAATITPTFSNINTVTYNTPDFEITDTKGAKWKKDSIGQPDSVYDCFDIQWVDGGNGKMVLDVSLADGAALAPGTYKFAISEMKVNGEETVSTAAVKLTVTAPGPKVTRTPAKVTVYANDPASRGVVVITLPDGTAPLANVTLKAAKAKTAADAFRIQKLDDNTYAIQMEDTGAITDEALQTRKTAAVAAAKKAKNGTTTLTLELWLEGNSATKPVTTTTVQVVVK